MELSQLDDPQLLVQLKQLERTRPHLIRQLDRLSEAELRLFRLLEKQGPMASPDVQMKLGISTVNASTRLKRLFDRGYLAREQAVDPTGGKVFIYRIA